MRKKIIISLLVFFVVGHTKANSGIFQSYVILDIDSGGNSYYAGGINSDGAPSFDGQTYNPVNSMTLNGGELKTYKNGGSDVYTGELYYRLYLQGSPAPAFQLINLPWVQNLPNPGDQKWSETSANIDIRQAIIDMGTGAGNYILEVYWRATSSDGDHYDSNAGSNFKATIVATASFLPVELVEFKGRASEKSNTLYWQTATETNNSHFEIQRSGDSRTWKDIGQVKGVGNSLQFHHYSFVDDKPLESYNFYRLKQVDFDGKFSFYKIIKLGHSKPEITIFPVPAQDYITVRLQELKRGSYNLRMLNSLGQLCINKTINESVSKIDVVELAPGFYAVAIVDESGELIWIQRVMKL